MRQAKTPPGLLAASQRSAVCDHSIPQATEQETLSYLNAHNCKVLLKMPPQCMTHPALPSATSYQHCHRHAQPA